MKGKRGEFRSLILIGIPTTGMVDIDFATNLLQTTIPVNTSPIWHVVRGKPVDEACNDIVKVALAANKGEGVDYIYFREDDVFTPQGAIERLMQREVDIISGTCFSKQVPPFPIIFRSYGGGPVTDWYDDMGRLIEVCGTGVACTLMKTEVFRNIEPPWFKTITFPEDAEEDGEKIKISRMTQDMYFYRKAIKAGYRIWVDTGVQCAHKDIMTETVFYYDQKLGLPAWLEKGAKEPSCIAPQKKTKRALPLSSAQREENLKHIRSLEEKEE